MRKIIISFIIIIFIVIFSTTISKAGVQIIKGATTYTSVNVSESFDICYNLRNGDSTLGTNTLDPHLATSLDWGAVAYLAQSRYGANATSTNSYNSTSTGNESGVKDTGGYMQTATLFENRNKTSTNAKSYRYRLEEALKTPGMEKYVDEISNTVNVTTTLGRAIAETQNWYGASYTFQNQSNTDYPIIIRDSLFGVNTNFNFDFAAGQAAANVTFRPVIWN
mgnify:FL=1